MVEGMDAPRIALRQEKVTVAPGGMPVPVEVEVTNASSVVDELVVWARSDAPWLESSTGKVGLLPRAEGAVELSLRVRDGALPDAGSWPVVITVRSTSSGATAEEHLEAVVPAVAGESTLWLESEVVRAAAQATFTVVVRNRANAPARIALEARGAEEGIEVHVTPAALEIGPRSEGKAAVEVRARRPLQGDELRRPFTVTAEVGGRTLRTSGTFVQTPRITSARASLLRTVLRVVLTAVGGLGLVFAAFARWTVEDPGTGVGWDVQAAVRAFGGQPDPRVPPGLSVGAVVVVLGALVLLGLLWRGGRLTRVAAVLAVAVAVATGGAAIVAGRTVAPGLVAVVVLGVVAYAGGAAARSPGG